MNAELAEKRPGRYAEEGGRKGWISCCFGYALAVRDKAVLDSCEGKKQQTLSGMAVVRPDTAKNGSASFLHPASPSPRIHPTPA